MKPIIDLQTRVFHAGLECMKPGVTFGEFMDTINSFGDSRGGQTRVLMSGRGVYDDGPLITPRSSGDDVRDVPLEAGNVFVWKPYALSVDGIEASQRAARWWFANTARNCSWSESPG